jgi:NADPH-dependent curcumin reductase CurA
MPDNRQWIMVKKPEGLASEEHLELKTRPTDEPGSGEVLIEQLYLSLDPGQNFYMQSSADVGGGTMKVGDVVRAWGVGRVIASKSGRYPVGSYVRDRYGFAGMQDYTILPESSLYPVDPALAPFPAQIGVLGMPGLTAYFGMIDIGRPQAGETAVVSGAAGVVGTTAGQLAQVKGARAVGIAGGPDKCRYMVQEIGFDACVDYRAEDFEEQLAAACPNGIDVFFDNVAGKILDSCLSKMAYRGRIVSCGAIAEYGTVGQWRGLHNYWNVLVGSLRWEGLSIHNYYDRYDEAYAALEGWFREGRLRHREEVADGLENFIPVFHRLFTGANLGKLVLKIRDEAVA